MEISVQHSDRVVGHRSYCLWNSTWKGLGFLLHHNWETQQISPSVTPGKNIRKTLGLLVREPPLASMNKPGHRRPDPPGPGTRIGSPFLVHSPCP